MKKFVSIIKKILNDISYTSWSTRIMSEAMEYDLDPQIVEAWLDANYKNHFKSNIKGNNVIKRTLLLLL